MSREFVKANHASLEMPNPAFAELMTAVLDKGAPFRFRAAGFSMAPFIRDGDVITIAPAPARIRFGEVVAFEDSPGGKLAVHRVVRISGDGYLTKGDNAAEPDARVPRPGVLGLVVRVEHRGKRVRFGLGIERAAIAFLSRYGWLIPVVLTAWRIVRSAVKRKQDNAAPEQGSDTTITGRNKK
jgi:signal peptidase I